MNSAEYIFNETSRERKREARGAFAMKNGSKSRKCSLPSDFLSAKEKRNMNSAVTTYNVHDPMDWMTFKKLPEDLAINYLDYLVTEYSARRKDVIEMFGCSPKVFGQWIYNHGMTGFFVRNCAKHPSSEWLSFLGGSNEPSESIEPEEVKVPSEESSVPELPKVEVKHSVEEATPIRGGLAFNGSASEVFNAAFKLFSASKRYRINIEFQEVDGEECQ